MKDKESILLVQTAFLGDIVLSSPAIGVIKNRFPECHLSVLTTFGGRELLKNDPRIDKIIVLDKKGSHKGFIGLYKFSRELKKENFTKVFSLHKSFRTAILLWLASIPERIGFKGAGFDFLYTGKKHRPSSLHDVERNLSLFDDVEEKEKELCLFQDKNPVPTLTDYVVVAPGSVWKTKRWSANHFRKLVKLLSHNHNVVVTGSKEEKELCDFVCGDDQKQTVQNLCGMASLSQSINIIANSKAVICNDSLPLHIASAFKRPLIALFCATSPEFGFGPWRTPHKILQANQLACKPCMRHGANYCPTGTELCRTIVTPEEVIDNLKQILC